jgi:hypothetical protein
MDLQRFIDLLRGHHAIDERDLISLFMQSYDILYQESTLISVTVPITI